MEGFEDVRILAEGKLLKELVWPLSPQPPRWSEVLMRPRPNFIARCCR